MMHYLAIRLPSREPRSPAACIIGVPDGEQCVRRVLHKHATGAQLNPGLFRKRGSGVGPGKPSFNQRGGGEVRGQTGWEYWDRTG